jgi:rhomboid protease GluP
MISLINVGLVIETMYGKKNMLITYFTSGIIGGLISIIIHGMLRDGVLSVGASGAICGLIGALLASLVGDVKTKTKIIILTILPILLIGFSSGNIDNISHFSCMFVGVIIGLILKKKK